MIKNRTVDLYVRIQTLDLKMVTHCEEGGRIRVIVTIIPKLSDISLDKGIALDDLKLAAIKISKQFVAEELKRNLEDINVLDCLSGCVVLEVVGNETSK